MFLVVLLGCGASSPGAAPSSAVGADQTLAAHTYRESGHQGMGSTSRQVTVDGSGRVSVLIESSGVDPDRRDCGSISESERRDLEQAIRRAVASGLSPLYNTSAEPGPDANYSRSEQLVLADGGTTHTVEIAGWADVPLELQHVRELLDSYQARCPQR